MSGYPNDPLPPDPMDALPGGTRLESVDEIRAAAQSRQRTTESEPVDTETLDFRPVRRPPMAVLCVIDDGRSEGEWFRLRQDTTIVGRSEGDILIPHDGSMSGRHLSIVRQIDRGRHRWFVNDLDSTNGSFARVSKTVLNPGQEVMLGGRRFRFDAATSALADSTVDTAVQGTRAWQSVQVTDLVPSLVEVSPRGEGTRIFLKQPDIWIGRDATACGIALTNDMMVSPRHARLYCDSKGTWIIENAGSRNGLWMRFKRLPVDTFCQVQVGEQRLLVKVLGTQAAG